MKAKGGKHMPIYNKLVRDLIPEIISSSGKTCTTRILSNIEWVQELKTKLLEEWEEYLQAKSVKEQHEELADLVEIIFTLGNATGAARADILQLVEKKRAERGAFNDKVYLIEVSDE